MAASAERAGGRVWVGLLLSLGLIIPGCRTQAPNDHRLLRVHNADIDTRTTDLRAPRRHFWLWESGSEPSQWYAVFQANARHDRIKAVERDTGVALLDSFIPNNGCVFLASEEEALRVADHPGLLQIEHVCRVRASLRALLLLRCAMPDEDSPPAECRCGMGGRKAARPQSCAASTLHSQAPA